GAIGIEKDVKHADVRTADAQVQELRSGCRSTGHALQNWQRVTAGQQSDRVLPAINEFLNVLGGTAKAHAQFLHQLVIKKTEISRLEALPQHRRSGKQRQRSALSAVGRNQQHFADTLKNRSGSVAVDIAHQRDGPITDGNVQVLAE